MHESWCELKKKQGFHHPKDCKHFPKPIDVQLSSDAKVYLKFCLRCHPDIDIPWEKLSKEQKEINRVGAKAMINAMNLLAEDMNKYFDELLALIKPMFRMLHSELQSRGIEDDELWK
jgi:hypothetical protein